MNNDPKMDEEMQEEILHKKLASLSEAERKSLEEEKQKRLEELKKQKATLEEIATVYSDLWSELETEKQRKSDLKGSLTQELTAAVEEKKEQKSSLQKEISTTVAEKDEMKFALKEEIKERIIKKAQLQLEFHEELSTYKKRANDLKKVVLEEINDLKLEPISDEEKQIYENRKKERLAEIEKIKEFLK